MAVVSIVGGEELNTVRADQNGNIYAIGSGFGTITTFDNFSFNHFGGVASNDVYILKYNSAGDIQWLKNGGSNKNDLATALSLDHEGNPIIAVKTGANTAIPCYFEGYGVLLHLMDLVSLNITITAYFFMQGTLVNQQAVAILFIMGYLHFTSLAIFHAIF